MLVAIMLVVPVKEFHRAALLGRALWAPVSDQQEWASVREAQAKGTRQVLSLVPEWQIKMRAQLASSLALWDTMIQKPCTNQRLRSQLTMLMP